MGDKTRAPQNRTLTILDSERDSLRAEVVSLQDFRQSYRDDSVVNADLMDCLDALPNGHFNLIIIDPPYNLTKNFHGGKFSSMKAADYEEYLRSWFYKICDKLSPSGTLYMCGDWKCTASMQRVIEERLTIINRISWQREKGRGAKANWKNSMEDIWFAVKDPNNFFFNVDAVMMKRRVIAPYKANGVPKDWEATQEGNFRLTYPSNFWDDISVPFWSMPENTDHPTQKPEKLFAKLVLASSKPGDSILDPFMGSGTAPVVAKKLGRHYCGIEINTEYCLWAIKRLHNAEGDTDIQGYSSGVFWERNTLAEQEKKKTKIPASNSCGSLFGQLN